MNKRSTTETFDEDTPISQDDITNGSLVLRRRVAGRVVQPKKRVTLYLDSVLVERFKEMAGERGYQTLINEALRNAVHQNDLETTLRKVIREELDGHRVA